MPHNAWVRTPHYYSSRCCLRLQFWLNRTRWPRRFGAPPGLIGQNLGIGDPTVVIDVEVAVLQPALTPLSDLIGQESDRERVIVRAVVFENRVVVVIHEEVTGIGAHQTGFRRALRQRRSVGTPHAKCLPFGK